jgi:hypothetical protein
LAVAITLGKEVVNLGEGYKTDKIKQNSFVQAAFSF